MDLKNALKSFEGRDGERAVSPVIGVILMVAITVILAAVIGTFVLGLGDQVSAASPNANFDFDYTAGNNDVVEIAHDGGDGIDYDQVKVTIDGATAWEYDSTDSFGANFQAGDEGPWTSKITAGDTLVIEESADDAIEDGDTVKIIWSADGSDKTAVIGESEVSL